MINKIFQIFPVMFGHTRETTFNIEKQHLIYFTALHSQIIYIYLLILKSKKPPFCIESSRKKINGQN